MSSVDVTQNELQSSVSLFQKAYQSLKTKLLKTPESAYSPLAERLSLLDQLCDFELGRSLIEHRSLSRYWRHYISICPPVLEKLQSQLEWEILTQLPIVLATQQRHRIFVEQLQQSIENQACLLSIPSGLMEEVAYLDYKHIDHIALHAMDNDEKAFSLAKGICESRGIARWLNFQKIDAFKFAKEESYDAISSNGLTLYEPDDEKVLEFYQRCFTTLKTKGKFITCFLTPPASHDIECEWDFSKICPAMLRKQKVLFSEILGVKWQSFRKTIQIRQMLSQVGFQDIEFYYDEAKMFPTVVGIKR